MSPLPCIIFSLLLILVVSKRRYIMQLDSNGKFFRGHIDGRNLFLDGLGWWSINGRYVDMTPIGIGIDDWDTDTEYFDD